MVYSYDYDRDYEPSLPVVDIHIQTTAGNNDIILQALVDSGSDATMIPLNHLKKIGARKGPQKMVRGIAGHTYIVDMYRIKINVGPFNMRLMVIADVQNQQTILGRDVLNHIIVTLNGLAGIVELSL